MMLSWDEQEALKSILSFHDVRDPELDRTFGQLDRVGASERGGQARRPRTCLLARPGIALRPTHTAHPREATGGCSWTRCCLSARLFRRR